MTEPENIPSLQEFLSILDTALFACTGDEEGEDVQVIRDVIMQTPCVREQPDAAANNSLNEIRNRLKAYLNVMVSSGSDSGFVRLCRIFGLDSDEILILLACLATSADLRYEHIYSFFQNGKINPTADTLLELAVGEGDSRLAALPLLQKDGRLLKNMLIQPAVNDRTKDLTVCYQAAPGIVELISNTWRSEIYEGNAQLEDAPKSRFPEMCEPYRFRITEEMLPMVSYFGPDSDFHFDIAGDVARTHGLRLLKLDLSESDLQSDGKKLLRYALRDAAMLGAILFIRGLDKGIDSAGVLDGSIGNLCNDARVPVIFSTQKKFIFSPVNYHGDRLILPISVPTLKGSQRLLIWEQELGEVRIDSHDLKILSGQFVLTAAQIRSAVNTAASRAALEERAVSLDDLYYGARSSSLHHLSELARRMPAKYDLGDLILPEAQREQISELIAMTKNRPMVLEEWGLGKKLTSGFGLSALFTGPPGTGKTLSAQVIAGVLGLELYRIDLSTVVSKYIGETEKNLEKIFTEAQNSNVILFFDEADSLFGKRSDVGDSKDRYANIEVGYLLQRIETYDGLAILATNLGANLDEAFTRRLNFIIDFPFPDEDIRLELWNRLLPDNVERSDDIDLTPLANGYRIAGGNIRNAIVTGVYRAAEARHPLCQEDLLHGIEREYQKMGRVFRSV